MARFRKKPVEIEALQLTDSPASLTAIVEWAASQGVEMVPEHDGQESHCLHFLTQNGVNTAYVGDWVVKDCGLFHRCSNAVFAETYQGTTPSSGEAAFVADVLEELGRARSKFPAPNLNMTALTEEVGEVAKTLLHTRFGGECAGWDNVYKEAVQTAVMAMRVALEGDPTLAAPETK